ncbi:MAG: hypothetical protein AAF556_01655, partial [Pseudomonadota bacterium]
EAVVEAVNPALDAQAEKLTDHFATLHANPASTAETDAGTNSPDDMPVSTLPDLGHRFSAALQMIEEVETEITALATAAMATPENASASEDFLSAIKEADEVLAIWAEKLNNISTAIALAQDAA